MYLPLVAHYINDQKKKQRLTRCKNSMTSQHGKADKFGKNKDKPDTCKYCGKLWEDLYYDTQK